MLRRLGAERLREHRQACSRAVLRRPVCRAPSSTGARATPRAPNPHARHSHRSHRRTLRTTPCRPHSPPPPPPCDAAIANAAMSGCRGGHPSCRRAHGTATGGRRRTKVEAPSPHAVAHRRPSQLPDQVRTRRRAWSRPARMTLVPRAVAMGAGKTAPKMRTAGAGRLQAQTASTFLYLCSRKI